MLLKLSEILYTRSVYPTEADKEKKVWTSPIV